MLSEVFYSEEQLQAVKAAIGLNVVKGSTQIDRHLGISTLEVAASYEKIKDIVEPSSLQISSQLKEKIQQLVEADGYRFSAIRVELISLSYGRYDAELKVYYLVPPTHADDILPVAIVPESVSDEALALLRQIRDGADVRCFHRYKVSHFTINDEAAPHLEKIIQGELYHEADGAFWDGYGYIHQRRFVSAFLTTENTYNEEDGVEERYLLKEAGVQFLDAHTKAIK